jgi:hypothetical protein
VSRPGAFTQSDVAKVLKGARQAGVSLASIEIDRTGKIIAHIRDGNKDAASAANDWSDRIRAKNQRVAEVRHRVS